MALLGQIIESLWGMGIPEEKLRNLPRTSPQALKTELRRRGIDDQMFARANALAEWRPDPKRTKWDNVKEMLRTAGFNDQQIDAVGDATHRSRKSAGRGQWSDEDLQKGLSEALGANVGVNSLIKVGAKPVGGWNPFRGDAPKGAAPQKPPKRWVDIPKPGAAPAGETPPEPVSDASLGDLGWGDLGLGAGDGLGDMAPQVPALSPNASEDEIQTWFRQYYGYAAWALDVPELRGLMLEIAQNPSGFTEEMVTGRIAGTQWWATNGVNVKNWLEKKKGNPKGAQEAHYQKFEEFRTALREADIRIPDERIWAMAEEALKYGWSEQTTQAVLASEYKFDPSKPTATTRNLKSKAKEYLVPLSDKTLGAWTKQILSGERSEEEFTQYLIETAKSMFPHLSEPLARGETVEKYTDVYKQWAARTLELDPETINFEDAKWMRVLNQVDPKTGERSAMTVADFDQLIRKDPQYGYEYTMQAKDEAGRLASGLMRKMGVS